MTKQNYEACAAGAKMGELAWQKSGLRDWMGEAHTQDWEKPGKSLHSLKESLLFSKPKEI